MPVRTCAGSPTRARRLHLAGAATATLLLIAAFAALAPEQTVASGIKYCMEQRVTVDLALGQLPTDGDDVIVGTDGADTIAAGAGDDIVCAGDGADSIWGQNGDDYILGDGGDDKLRGGDGDDHLIGGDGADDINGGRGDDFIGGLGGDDKLRGGTGDDYVAGGEGDDELIAGNGGEDTLFGNEGSDRLRGGPRADEMHGGPGNDVMQGLGGPDRLFGGLNDDNVLGGNQGDEVNGGPGIDTCNAGAQPAFDTHAECEGLVNSFTGAITPGWSNWLSGVERVGTTWGPPLLDSSALVVTSLVGTERWYSYDHDPLVCGGQVFEVSAIGSGRDVVIDLRGMPGPALDKPLIVRGDRNVVVIGAEFDIAITEDCAAENLVNHNGLPSLHNRVATGGVLRTENPGVTWIEGLNIDMNGTEGDCMILERGQGQSFAQATAEREWYVLNSRCVAMEGQSGGDPNGDAAHGDLIETYGGPDLFIAKMAFENVVALTGANGVTFGQRPLPGTNPKLFVRNYYFDWDPEWEQHTNGAVSSGIALSINLNSLDDAYLHNIAYRNISQSCRAVEIDQLGAPSPKGFDKLPLGEDCRLAHAGLDRIPGYFDNGAPVGTPDWAPTSPVPTLDFAPPHLIGRNYGATVITLPAGLLAANS